MSATIDQTRLEAFLGTVANEVGAAMNTALVAIGDRLGLYRAMADSRPVSAAELAARTSTHERYVREWLNTQAASGFVTYDPADDRYTLPPEQALVLADESSPVALAGLFQSAMGAMLSFEHIADRFTNGEGFGWHEHHDHVFHGIERFFAGGYRTHLVAEWIPALEGVEERLAAGARVADVGCGHGASTIVLAEAFPASTFTGYDYHEASIAVARERAAEAGVSDRVAFEVADAESYPAAGYDLIATFDALHDMGDPVAAARHARAAIAEDGTWLIVEPLRQRPHRGQPRSPRARALRLLDPALPARLPRPARPPRPRHVRRPGPADGGHPRRWLHAGAGRRRDAVQPDPGGAAVMPSL